jgi:hypothetical protein
MKRSYYLYIIPILVLVSSTFQRKYPNEELLSKIIQSIDSMSACKYVYETTSNSPRDPAQWNSHKSLVTYYPNKNDTLYGSRFSDIPINEDWDLGYIYDGKNVVNLHIKEKLAEIDTAEYASCGIPAASIFIMSKALISYALTNPDCTEIKIENASDSIKLNFCFTNRVLWFGCLIPYEEKRTGVNTYYELWVNQNLRPFKIWRRIPSQTFIITCSKIEPLNDKGENFDALLQIPSDFKIEKKDFIRH